jgi:hypothetical protein
MTRLPVTPLARLVALRGGARWLLNAACPDGTSRRRLYQSYSRGLRRGTLTPYAADQLAVRLLCLHPSAVWGELWWDRDRAPLTRLSM